MKFGAHISSAAPFSETINRAVKEKCECMQIFVNLPQRWNPLEIPEKEIEKFIENNKKAKIEPIIIHSIYLINLASSNPFFYQASQKSLIDDMKKAKAIGALGVNTHLGSTKERDLKDCIDQIVQAIENILTVVPEGPDFIIENSAGAGNIIGDTLEEIGQIVKATNSERVKVLIDTAHAFASGYDIRSRVGVDDFVKKFDKEIGLEKLVGLHLNDSASIKNSHRDRHADIGEGGLGIGAFKLMINHPKLKDLFGIIETPSMKGKGGVDNLTILRSL
ncbi:MAG: deoxyribonuclease IV [Patescibacteria group bacterium]